MRRPQTPRYACQFGRLASTSSVGAWTPCAGSSAAVDALGSDPSSAEHARPSYRTAASNRGEFDAWLERRWQTRRPPPDPAADRARLAGEPSPVGERTAEILAGATWRTLGREHPRVFGAGRTWSPSSPTCNRVPAARALRSGALPTATVRPHESDSTLTRPFHVR